MKGRNTEVVDNCN